MGQLAAIVTLALVGGGVLTVTVGLLLSMLALAFFTVQLLAQRNWVPVTYNLRSLGVRKVTTAVTGLGLALVVFVFTTVLMLASGITRTLASTGLPENAKIIRKGSLTEMQSFVTPEAVRLLSSQPEIARGKDGRPLLSAEVITLIFAHLPDAPEDDSRGANIAVRGIGPEAFELHPEVRIDGRPFKAGTSEVVVGKGLIGRFAGFVPGGTLHFARRDWNIVGVIDGHGSAYDSEIWGDVDQVMDAFQRRPTASAVTLRLEGASALQTLEAKLASDPKLNTLEIASEIDYWAKQSEGFADFVRYLGIFVAVIFAFGAILGAMITMYAQVAARTREIGTLRALGFGRHAILVSFVVESTILALLSGGLGIVGASFMRHASFTAMNFQSFSQVTFRFDLTPGILGAAVLFAALMGYAGGLLPATRAARMPIVRATRGG